jgi:formylglycine-generating enzyme required for sulfatase activity
MYCESCKVEFSEGLRYCKWCGGQLSERSRVTSELHKCHSCGASVQPGWAYCKSCGVRLLATARQSEVICPRCGTAAPPPAVECSKCGQDLTGVPETEPESAGASANVYCPSCGGQIEQGATFCKACGAITAGAASLTTPDLTLSGACPQCGNRNQPASTHCRVCGTALSSPLEIGSGDLAGRVPADDRATRQTLPDLPRHTTRESLAEPAGPGDSGRLIRAVTHRDLTPPLAAEEIRPQADTFVAPPTAETRAFSGDGWPDAQPHANQFDAKEPGGGQPHARMEPPGAAMAQPGAGVTPPSANLAPPTGGGLTRPDVSVATPEPGVPSGPVTGYQIPTPQDGAPGIGVPLAFDQPAPNAAPPSQAIGAAPKKQNTTLAIASVAIASLVIGASTFLVWRYFAGRGVAGRAAASRAASRDDAAGKAAGRTATEPDTPSTTPASDQTAPQPSGGSSTANPAPEGMVLVEAGSYTIGRDNGDQYARPGHTVSLPSFYVDRTEVTNAQYKAFVDASGHKAPPGWKDGTFSAGHDSWPVTEVTWQDASDYASWAGKRLPTEAEWEAAARGPEGRIYPWGDSWRPGMANIKTKGLTEVGHFKDGASPAGALDMIGNVWEWTADEFKLYPGSKASLPDVMKPGVTYRVIRGGAYDCNEKNDASYRGFVEPNEHLDKTGFRCVKDINK